VITVTKKCILLLVNFFLLKLIKFCSANSYLYPSSIYQSVDKAVVGREATSPSIWDIKREFDSVVAVMLLAASVYVFAMFVVAASVVGIRCRSTFMFFICF